MFKGYFENHLDSKPLSGSCSGRTKIFHRLTLACSFGRLGQFAHLNILRCRDTVQMPLNLMDAHFRSFAQIIPLD
jgi:hypothetical protein